MPDNTAIRSFQVSAPEADVAEMRRRIKMSRGCHFAAWEQPKIFTDEVRASFKTLRT